MSISNHNKTEGIKYIPVLNTNSGPGNELVHIARSRINIGPSCITLCLDEWTKILSMETYVYLHSKGRVHRAGTGTGIYLDNLLV